MLEKIQNKLRQGLLALMLVTLVITSFPLNIAIVQAADTTPPLVTIDTPGNSSIFELGVNITYTYTVVEINQSTEEVLLDSNPIPDTGTISGLGTGTYNLTVVSTDNSSNVGWDQITFFVSDTVNPVATVTSPTNASLFELGEDVAYSYTVDDLSSTTVVVRQNGFIISDTGILSGLSVGPYTLNIEATDLHNNIGSDEIIFFVQDTTAPIVTITSPVNASTYEYGGDVAYTYSATDLSGVTATILLNGGEVPDTGLLSNPGIGTHNLTINIVDDHNNVDSDQITFFVQDTISPVVTITSPANNSIYELGTDVAYAYIIDDQSATSVIVKLDDSPISDTGLLTSLPVGTYVLKVEADDGFSVIGYDEIFFSITDTISPVVSITSPFNNSYFELGSDVTYSYTTSDLSGLSVVVKLNGAPIADTGTIPGLAVGTYTLTIEATDIYSNFGSDEVVFFIEDTVSPVVTIDSPENASTFEFGNDISYAYTVTDLSSASVVVRLNGAPIADSGLISGLSVGTYTLIVEATDAYGNVGTAETVFFYLVDTIPPVVTITSPSNDSSFEFGSDVSYTYTVSDLSSTTVVVKLNGAPIGDTGLISSLPVGTYTLTVEATDLYSNFGSDEVVFYIQDTTDPIVTITSPSNASTFEFGTDVLYTYAVTDLSGTSVVVKLNGAPIPDSGTLSGLAVGIYTLTVEAIDLLSNFDSDEIVLFVQDTTSPVVVVTSPSNASTFEFSDDVSYMYTVNDLSGTSIIVKLNGAPIADSGTLSGLAVGTYTLIVEATDQYSNFGSDEIIFFVQDTTSPVVAITSPANASIFEFGNDISYTYTVTDLSTTSVVVRLNGAPITDTGLISGLSVGTYTLFVEATDAYGNVGTAETVFFYLVDTIPPVVTITSPSNDSSFEFGSDVSYTYTVSDLSSTTVVVKLNGAPIGDTGLISSLPVGTYTLTVEATDLYSNFGSDQITFFIEDTTDPIVTITSPSNASTFEFGSDVSYSYTVTDLSSSSVVVRLNGAPIPDSGTLTGLAVGTYTLNVEATDTYGNVGTAETVFFYLVDTIPPVVTITSPANDSTFEFGSDITYTYTVSDLSGTSVIVKLNGAPIPDSGTFSGLAVGTYTLTVEATDTYSNLGTDSVTLFVVDTTSPTVDITTPGNNTYFEYGSDVSYTYTVDDLSGESEIVKLNGAPIPDSGLLTNLPVGTYTLRVESTDSYNNVGFDEVLFFVQDTIVPIVTIDTPANNSIFEYGDVVTYTYSITDLSSTTALVRLNGAPIPDSGSLSGLPVGSYLLNVEATDAHGNVGDFEISFSVQDTTSPVVTILSPANSSFFEFGDNVPYSYSVTDLSGTSVVVKLNGAPIPDTELLTSLPVGTYVFRVEATDLYSNIGSEEIIFFVQDTTLPMVVITSPVNSSTFEFGTDVSYTYTVTDLSGTSVVVRVNGAPIADTGLISSLSVGTYTLVVEATDVYGNVGTAETVFFYLVDTIPPVVTITSPGNDSVFEFGSDVTYTYSVSDLSGTSVVVKLNGAPIADSGLLSSLPVGTYMLTVEATDAHSNFGSDEITFFVQDTILPVVAITSPVNASIFEFGTDVSYTYTVTDLSGTSVVVRLNGAPIADTGLIAGLTVGTYTLNVEATDVYGNVGNAETTFFYLVDTTSPIVSITAPANSTVFEFGVEVNYDYTVFDLSSTSISVKLNGVPIADSGLLSGLPVGTYTLTVEATDVYANVGSDEITFFVQDTIIPVVTITDPSNSSIFEFGANVDYTYIVTDLSSTTVVVRLNGAPIADSGSLNSLAVGTYVLNVEATDAHNNVGVDQITFFVVDTTNPIVVIVDPSNATFFEFGDDIIYSYTVTDLSSTTIVVRLNGGPIADSGILSGLAVGTYTLNVEATDTSNNVGVDQITFFVVDTTNPAVTITNPSNASSFEFGGDVNYAYTIFDLSGTSSVVSLDSVPISDIGVLSGLSVGTYTLSVEATDVYSNVGYDEITFFVIDTTSPVVDITSPLNSSIFEFGTDVSYTYTVFDLSGTSVVVSLNSVPIADTGMLIGLPVGTYTLNVEVTDAYGNVGTAESTFFFLVDTTPPIVTTTAPTNATFFEFGDDVPYTYSVFDLSSYSVIVQLNGADIADTGLIPGLAVGTYELYVEATDIYNNQGSDMITFFVQDTILPVVSITDPLNNSIFEFGDIVFYGYTTSDLSVLSVEVKLDGAVISDLGVLVNLAVGTYKLSVGATDAHGNLGLDEVFLVVDDTILPVVGINTPENETIFEFGNDILYTYQYSDLSSTTVEVLLDGVGIANTGVISDVVVGSHLLQVRVTDSSNNIGIAEITIFVQDTTKPVIFVSSPLSEIRYPETDPIPLNIQILELANYSVTVYLNGSILAVDPYNGFIPIQEVGFHLLNITVIDASGNVEISLTMFEVYDVPVDIKVTLVSPNGGEVIASDLWTISWTLENPWKLNTTYNIYYSINQSDTWVLIQQNLTTTSYQWDTTSLVTSFVYEIKIEAMTVYNSQIMTSEDISDNYFTVANRKVTVEIDIPDTIPEVLSSGTPGFELPILLLGLIGMITLLRRRK